MIETPRAALRADEIAEEADFFSLRHQRPHADDVRLQPRRRREPHDAGLPRARAAEAQPVRDDRPDRRRRARAHRRRAGPCRRSPTSSSASAASTAAIPSRSPSSTTPGSTTCRARRSASRSPGSPPPRPSRCGWRHALKRCHRLAQPVQPTSPHIDVEWWAWVGLFGLILVLLLVDLLVFHRRAHTIGTKEAALESSVWIGIGLAFGLVILALYGGQATGEYYAGYLIEKSLSIDNVFVWALIFSYFVVPRQFQHRVLFWGIFGALVHAARSSSSPAWRCSTASSGCCSSSAPSSSSPASGCSEEGRGGPSGEQPGAAARAQGGAVDDGLRRPEALHARERQAAAPRRCSRCWCSSRRPTWCSPWTRCRRCWP